MITIEEANEDHISLVAILFDLYRQFYDCEPNLKLATDYIKDRLVNKESTIFVAMDNSEALGFVQLYPSFCSVEAIKIHILYDLYVTATARGSGIGERLMNRASEFAKASGSARIDLLTENNNKIGQRLYEKMSYERTNQEFFAYSLYL